MPLARFHGDRSGVPCAFGDSYARRRRALLVTGGCPARSGCHPPFLAGTRRHKGLKARRVQGALETEQAQVELGAGISRTCRPDGNAIQRHLCSGPHDHLKARLRALPSPGRTLSAIWNCMCGGRHTRTVAVIDAGGVTPKGLKPRRVQGAPREAIGSD